VRVFPVPTSHSRRDLHGSARYSSRWSSRFFAIAISLARPTCSIACTLVADVGLQRAARGEIILAEVESPHGVVVEPMHAVEHRPIDIVVAGFRKPRDIVRVRSMVLMPNSKADSRAPHGGAALELGGGSRLGRWFAWQARGGRNRRSSGPGVGSGNHSLSLSAVNDPEERAPRAMARGAAR
jgi:hypothetical protein